MGHGRQSPGDSEGLERRCNLRLEIYRGKGRQPWRWRLRYDNDERAAISEEGFPTSRAVARAVWRFFSAAVDECVRPEFTGEECRWSDMTEREFVAYILRGLKEQGWTISPPN